MPLVRVALGMGFVPVPGGADDILDFGEPGFPVEGDLSSLGGGYEFRRVTDTAGLGYGGDGFSCDLFAGPDDLEHGATGSGSEVEGALDAWLEGKDMGLGEIDHVDVIADAGAVRGGVIGAVDFAMFFLAEGDLEHIGDEVGFDAVVFAVLFGGAGGVEVAEGDVFELVDASVPMEHPFEHEFGFAVGVDG